MAKEDVAKSGMAKDDDTPHALVRRSGIAFAYICFAVSVATIASAIYLLPTTFKVKVFLVMATLLLVFLFLFMAVATHMVSRRNAGGTLSDPD